MTSVTTGRPRDRGSIPVRRKKFVFALGSTKLPVKCIPSFVSGWGGGGVWGCRSVRLSTHVHLIPSVRMIGAIPSRHDILS